VAARIVVVGHTGAGKSSLIAALEPALPIARFIEAPGDPERGGELAPLVVDAELLLVVVSALDGLSPATIAAWHLAEAAGLPCVLAVTHLEDDRADLAAITAICERVFEPGIAQLGVEVYDDSDESHPVTGVLRLLSGVIASYEDDPYAPRLHLPDTEHIALTAATRDHLIETITHASHDEKLLELFASGAPLTDPEAVAALTQELYGATREGALAPLLPVAAPRNVGLAELAEVVEALAR
jgi:elongation factor G